jgi:DNA-binding Xre family transcriptional regulator
MKTYTVDETLARAGLNADEIAELRHEVAAEIEAERMTLAELRKARGQTQATLADAMGVAQAEVSRMERRTDVYIGTLRRFVEALGGELRIVANFSTSEVELTGFGELGRSTEPPEVS